MGGNGSGRWGMVTKKRVVEDCLVLAVDKLKLGANKVSKPGLLGMNRLTWTRSSDGRITASIGFWVNTQDINDSWVRLFYRRGNVTLEYKVSLVATTPNYGGLKWYFLCPLIKNKDQEMCAQRVGKLYLPPGSSCFGCRDQDCHNLIYRSSKESHLYRSYLKRLSAGTPSLVGRSGSELERVFFRKREYKSRQV